MVENAKVHFPDEYKKLRQMSNRKPKPFKNQETVNSGDANLPCLESEEATEGAYNNVLNSKEEDENCTVPHITSQGSSLRAKIEGLEGMPGGRELLKRKSPNSS